MTKRPLPTRLVQPLALRAEDDAWPNRTVLTGRDDYLDAPRVLDEMQERFGLLWDHYVIDPNATDAWKLLAVALAFDHVPGFRVTKPGRKKAQRDLLTQFDEVRRSSKRRVLSDMEIAGKIGKADGTNGLTILRRYQEQKAEAESRLSQEDQTKLIAKMAAQLNSK